MSFPLVETRPGLYTPFFLGLQTRLSIIRRDFSSLKRFPEHAVCLHYYCVKYKSSWLPHLHPLFGYLQYTILIGIGLNLPCMHARKWREFCRKITMTYLSKNWSWKKLSFWSWATWISTDSKPEYLRPPYWPGGERISNDKWRKYNLMRQNKILSNCLITYLTQTTHYIHLPHLILMDHRFITISESSVMRFKIVLCSR